MSMNYAINFIYLHIFPFLNPLFLPHASKPWNKKKEGAFLRSFHPLLKGEPSHLSFGD